MRVVDWRRVLTENRIPFIERGANVSRGEINIKCPYCGSADPSYHMGLNLENGWWACWRNHDHRGKSPLRLLVTLLGIGYHAARELAGLDPSYVDPEGFDAVAARLLRPVDKEEVEDEQALTMPSTFQAVDVSSIRSSRHASYLSQVRGFPRRDIPRLVEQYQIKYSLTGDFKDRIILPYYLQGELVTWTGRSITNSEIRYRDLDKVTSLVPPKDTLYNHDAAKGARVLLVVEGPIDVLKADFYGAKHGVRAVGLSTNSITDEQIYLLEDLALTVGRVIIMLDTQSSLGVVGSMRLRDRVGHIENAVIQPVPFGRKDAGELTPREATAYARSLIDVQVQPAIRKQVQRLPLTRKLPGSLRRG